MKHAPKIKSLFPFKKNKRGLAIISVILIAFILIAFFLITHLVPQNYLPSFLQSETPSYAAKGTTNTAPYILEAETLSTYSLSGGLQVVDDTTASGGQALMFAINTTSNGQVNLPNPATQVSVTVKGERCKGNPDIILTIDDMEVLNKGVSATSYDSYSASVNLSAGSHNIAITFPNDLTSNSGQTCDRSIKVDKLSFQ
jgi:hypothetical protein